MSIVVIVGAGASAHMHAPVMNDFFEVAENLAGSGVLQPESEADFEKVRRARSRLQQTLAKSRFDLRNLETVFAAFEMADLLGLENSLLGVSDSVSALRRVIATTLEERMQFPVVTGIGSGKRVVSGDGYMRLIEQVMALQAPKGRIGIITFNYDLGLDVAIHAHQRLPSYGFDSDEREDSIDVFKLHGSLNWFQCEGCDQFVVHHIRDVISDTMEWRTRTDQKGADAWLRPRARQRRKPFTHCANGKVGTEPFLVPPTLQKLSEQHRLKAIWRKAAQRLQTAKYIVIIGYSWPANDQFFHQLFALSGVSETILRRVVVIDTADSTIAHIKDMLAENVREAVVPLQTPFGSGAVDSMVAAIR